MDPELQAAMENIVSNQTIIIKTLQMMMGMFVAYCLVEWWSPWRG